MKSCYFIDKIYNHDQFRYFVPVLDSFIVPVLVSDLRKPILLFQFQSASIEIILVQILRIGTTLIILGDMLLRIKSFKGFLEVYKTLKMSIFVQVHISFIKHI